MASAPVVPATSTAAPKPAAAPITSTDASITATIKTELTWVKTHVFLLVFTLALILGTAFGAVTLFNKLIEAHDARAAAAQQQKEGVDITTQSQLLQQLQATAAADAARDAQQAQLIQTLVAQMTQQHTATAKQIQTDSTLDAQGTGARLAQQTNAGPKDVTIGNEAVTLSLPLARIVVSDLDTLTQAQSDISNLNGQLTAQKILTSDAISEKTQANAVIAADKTELIATIKGDNDACNLRVDVAVAKANKRTVWGTILGVVGGVLIAIK